MWLLTNLQQHIDGERYKDLNDIILMFDFTKLDQHGKNIFKRLFDDETIVVSINAIELLTKLQTPQ
jgi:hypothetical protein